METIITKAICLNYIDYKDNDRLVKIFSIDLGVITAQIKGVRKAKAKLKMLTEPFCFAELSLLKKTGSYQIISGTIIDSFFDLTKILDRYYLGNVLLESTLKCLPENVPTAKVFINLLKSLKALCYENKNAEFVVGHYLSHLLIHLGYRLNFLTCSNCSSNFDKKLYFDFDKGSFICEKCKSEYSKLVDIEFLEFLKLVSETPLSESNKIEFYKLNLKPILEFLAKDLSNLTEKKLVSVESYLKFMEVFG